MNNDTPPKGAETGPVVVSNRTMEILTALGLLVVGVMVMADSYRLGNGWDSNGPQAGYFPFYIALALGGSCLVILATSVFTRPAGENVFIRRAQLYTVLQVLVPAAIFVIAIGWIGIYFAAGIYIGVFMWWIGKYPLYKILPVSVLVPAALFVMFEIWFLVPLPKGPIETALGY